MKVLAAALVGLSMSAPLSAQTDETTIEQRLNKQIDLVCIANGHALPVRLERRKDGTLTALDQWADAAVITTRRAVAVLRGNDFLHISGDLALTGAIDGDRIDGECVDLRPHLEDALWSLVHDGEEMGELVAQQRKEDLEMEAKNQRQIENANEQISQLRKQLSASLARLETVSSCADKLPLESAALYAFLSPDLYVGISEDIVEHRLDQARSILAKIKEICQ